MDYVLVHHGILGQKWGKRNGPPYPLGASPKSRRSKTEQRLTGSKRSKSAVLGNKSNSSIEKNSKKDSFSLTDNQKRAIKIGAAVAVAALATYGTYKLAKSGKLNELAEIGKQKVDGILQSKNTFVVDNISQSEHTVAGIKMLSHTESVEEVLTNVNPSGSRHNCYNVVVATAARLCGLDVVAKGDTQGRKGLPFEETCKVFKLNSNSDTDIRHIYSPTVDKLSSIISKKYKEGDVGAIGIDWNEAYWKRAGISGSSGHTLNWIIRNGRVEFIDGQARAGNSVMRMFLSQYIDSGKEASVARFANVNAGIDINSDIDVDLFRKFAE